MNIDKTEILESLLREELLDYFIKEGFEIIGVKKTAQYPFPPFLHNDGYGDQKNKMPDILGFDMKTMTYHIGVIRAERKDLDSESALTEYNVFLDQVDKKSGKFYNVFIIVPPPLLVELQTLIHHYIHREYWHRLTVIASSRKH